MKSAGFEAWLTTALISALLAMAGGLTTVMAQGTPQSSSAGVVTTPAPVAVAPPVILITPPPELAPVDPRVRGPFVVIDAESSEVLSHSDAIRPWFPASTTKLMTLYVAFAAIRTGEFTLLSPVTVSEHAASEPASKMGFKPGTALTLEDALKIMMVKSANDVAMAVAETIGGSQAGFAARMNAESIKLGMTGSNWVNPNGLPDPAQVTTARDMAVLGRALWLEFPEHRAFLNLHAIRFGRSVLENYNSLLTRFPGANGMKTGFICASGYNLVASAQRGTRTAIAVVFGEYSGRERTERAAELLTQAFATPPAPEPEKLTLENVRSGENYTTPLDMRPHVCSPDKAATAADAPQAEQPVLAKGLVAGDSEPVSYLVPKMDLGPPIEVSVIRAGQRLRPGQPGFLARLPRSRPAAP